MSCEHLVCANCAGPVAEGRCPTCRASREHLHSSTMLGLSTQTLLALLVVVLAVAALAAHLS